MGINQHHAKGPRVWFFGHGTSIFSKRVEAEAAAASVVQLRGARPGAESLRLQAPDTASRQRGWTTASR